MNYVKRTFAIRFTACVQIFFVIGRGLAAIKDNEGFQSYIFYMLKERFFKDDIVGNGSIFASITKDELLGQKFLVPDLMLR